MQYTGYGDHTCVVQGFDNQPRSVLYRILLVKRFLHYPTKCCMEKATEGNAMNDTNHV